MSGKGNYRSNPGFSEGVNSQGNYYQHRGDGQGQGGSYYYSNSNGSYYYQNADSSTYYGLGSGQGGVYTAPGAPQGSGIYHAPKGGN